MDRAWKDNFHQPDAVWTKKATQKVDKKYLKEKKRKKTFISKK